jgi:MSHA pilin protein MshC
MVSKLKGFTLVEMTLVLVMVGIIGASAYPLFTNHQLFQERFSIDEISNVLHYSHRVAMATGCEVQIQYHDQKELTFYQREDCTSGEFTKPLLSPYLLKDNPKLTVMLPSRITLRGHFPLYISSNGKMYDQYHHWHGQFILQLNARQIIIDGLSGIVYEKSAI